VGVLAAAALVVALNRPEAGATDAERRPIDAHVAFFRDLGKDVVPEALGDAADVEVGDKLFLTARASEPFYLYVFNQDLELRQFRLVPDGSALEYLPADTEVRLPADVDNPWVVNTRGGTEYIFVVASPRPLPQLAGLIAFIDTPKAESSDQGPSQAVAALRGTLRGIGGVEKSAVAPELLQGIEQPKLDLLVEFAYFEASLDPAERVMFERLELKND
jgi:hypothetical protein